MSHLYLYNTFELIHLGNWSLNLNTLKSRFDFLNATLSLIFLLQFLKTFVTCFLTSNYVFPKFFRDVVISFFCVVVEYCIRLMNNLFRNL